MSRDEPVDFRDEVGYEQDAEGDDDEEREK